MSEFIAYALVASAAALVAIYWFVGRPGFASWGATGAALARTMPGDIGIVDPADANYRATLAITIAARPEHIWPWLVQMGYRRGGLYSYDWLDRVFGYLDRPSATSLLPEFQRLNAGDEIPVGRAGGCAGSMSRGRMPASSSFCTSCAAMWRTNVGGSTSPQSWCTMSKYSRSPTMTTFSIAPVV